MGAFVLDRLVKPMLLFLVTFLAVRYITKSAFDGFVVALIPAVLGLTNVYIKFGYTVATLSLIALAFFVVTPPSVRDPVVARVTHAVNDIVHPSSPEGPAQAATVAERKS